MGGPPALDSRPLLVLPDTPPQLVSPSATSFSSRSSPSTDQVWDRRGPASAPMSAVEMSVDRSADAHNRAVAAAPRQQLPSLSSLFGPPSVPRPLHSPVSDRPGSYTSTSPLDRPRLSSSDRNQPPSYFPPTLSPPVSQPRSTFDVDRQQRPPIARSYSGSGSPGYRDPYHGRSQSRSEMDGPGRWSLQHETSRQEYSLGSREPPLQSPRDQFRLQFPGVKDHSGGNYPEHRSHPHPPPTPTSTIISDTLPTKDGLGPKIWTGTHFLPRFVRAAEVPGEGMCYFYDDGSHCKTVIDGEAVNAHWGVTKAGKPRKRLAIACVTCRDKKIKCDPDFPRCVQCEKFGRICKFKNAPRGGHNTSPSTPPAELDDYRRLNGSRTNGLRLSESDAGSPVSPGSGLHHDSPEAGGQKRLKLGPDAYVRNGDLPSSMPRLLDHGKTALLMQRPSPESGSRIPDDVLTQAWRTDPFVKDPHAITAVVSQFFAIVDSSMILRFLPEEAFKSWLASPVHRKSAEDLMLLYSLLAVGVALSGGPTQIAFEYAQVAHHAQKTTAVNCLQLAQSRILLGMYYASTSRLCESNELMSAAAGTMACLQLNFELDKSREAGLPVYPFGMNKEAYCEARRRTFWSLYMLERLNGMYPDRLAFIDAEDVYTRLPADLKSFEKQLETHMPAFDPYELNLPKMTEQPLEMAPYVVEMVHIWATCVAGVYRLARRPISSEVEIEKVQNLAKRVHEWHSALPTRYTFSSANMDEAALAGNVGSFVTMHALYHHAMIKLNRHRQGASQLSAETLATLSQRCRNHATSILDIVYSVDRILRLKSTSLRTPPPTVAAAATEALDVLTATGSVSRIGDAIENVRVAKSVVDSVANVWQEARKMSAAMGQRLEILNRIRDQGSRPASPVEGYRVVLGSSEFRDEKELRWQMADPFEKLYSKDIDVIYFSLVE